MTTDKFDTAVTPEKAVMVCPQCDGVGSYADGLDEAACSTECARCDGNGWIVDVAALAALEPVAVEAEPTEKPDKFAYWNSLPESEKQKIRQGFHNDMYGGTDD